MKLNSKGQAALEYLLMLVIVLTLLMAVVALTNNIGGVGATVGSVISQTKTQVVAWLMT